MTKNKFTVDYSNKDILEKIEQNHIIIIEKIEALTLQVKAINGKVGEHTRDLDRKQMLIYGSYGFTFAVLAIVITYLLIR